MVMAVVIARRPVIVVPVIAVVPPIVMRLLYPGGSTGRGRQARRVRCRRGLQRQRQHADGQAGDARQQKFSQHCTLLARWDRGATSAADTEFLSTSCCTGG